MIAKLLIANRGEIAVRIASTARKMGVRTVAVYSDADRSALHTRVCDESIHIGAAPSSESYLVIDRIIEAMRTSGANAVHPGYGFLSENADFAEAVEAEGLIFVGPTSATIRSMGSKASAKAIMEKAGVPVTPGYQGDDQSIETFNIEAQRIGYPVLLKASAGGGGKGMRLVNSAHELNDALDSAKRESLSAFADETLLIEKYVKPARHVEVQIFGDGQGEVVHLYDRDCSIQRRHQKIIEEAPAFGLDAKLREGLLEAGVNAGKAVKYRGAGTVEFLYDIKNKAVYFMEMNTRLQVEHPVTEMITGVDLVEWQLRLASGEGIPSSQQGIQCAGHSIEARVYAEDTYNDFVPSTGKLESLHLSTKARNDCGVESGQEISPFYDPMITKIVVKQRSRKEAISALLAGLSETRISGVETNLEFLGRVTAGSGFLNGDVSTSYIEDHQSVLFNRPQPSNVAWGGAIMHIEDHTFSQSLDPWDRLRGFRLNASSKISTWLQFGDEIFLATVSEGGRESSVQIESQVNALSRKNGDLPFVYREFKFSGISCGEGKFLITIGGDQNEATVLSHRGGVKVFVGVENWNFTIPDVLMSVETGNSVEGSLTSPMSGIVTALIAKIGEVRAGEVLLTIEAMKMEHKILVPFDGTLESYRFKVGQQVREGDLLVDLE